MRTGLTSDTKGLKLEVSHFLHANGPDGHTEVYECFFWFPYFTGNGVLVPDILLL